MDQVTQGFGLQGRIDLAREADFALGPMRIRPSRCEIEADGVRRLVQRRVMQVLVALAHSTSEVVSQRELILRCWGGLSVSNDAIGRCIGQLRRLAGGWAAPPFKIETIPGVGYCLLATDERPCSTERALASKPLSQPRPLQMWATLAGAALASALLIFHFGRPVEGRRAVSGPAIAVLGFEPARARLPRSAEPLSEGCRRMAHGQPRPIARSDLAVLAPMRAFRDDSGSGPRRFAPG